MWMWMWMQLTDLPAPLLFLVVAALTHSPHSPCRGHTIIHCAQYQRLLPTACICLSLHAPAWLIDRGEASLPPRHARAPAAALSTHPTPARRNRAAVPDHSLTHSLTTLTIRHDIPENHPSLYSSPLLSLALVRHPRLHAYTPHQSIHHPTACTRLCCHEAAVRPPPQVNTRLLDKT